MFRVYECIVLQHDWRFLAAALVIGIAGAITTVALFRHARSRRDSPRLAWNAAAAAAGAGSVWCTHFVAMLGFEAAVVPTYDAAITLVSLLLAFGTTLAGLSLASGGRRWQPAAGGAIFGAGIGIMHYAGVAAADFGVPIRWQLDLVAASYLFGICFAAAALTLAARPAGTLRMAAAPCLLLAIGALHFTAMAALVLEVEPMLRFREPTPPLWLAAELTTVGLGLVLAAAATLLVDRNRDRQEAARIRDFADLALEGLLITDGKTVVAVNESFVTLSGCSRQDLVGIALSRFVSDPVLDRLTSVAPAEPVEFELVPRDGVPIPVEIVARHTQYCGTGHLVIAFRDLRARREAEDRIRFLAYNDPLTGLANRESFRWQLGKALGATRRGDGGLALLALDLDNFKGVNDTLGHPVGDRLLTVIAERIEATCRAGDIVARLGGDEFAVVQTGSPQPAAAESLARRLIEVLSRPVIIDGQIVVTGTSIGIALAEQDGASAELLAKHADLALYRAKEMGRGTFAFFESEMDKVMRERRALENDLRLALARREFELHYQPLTRSEDGRIIGFEALLRWPHPERGNIPPSTFIPLAEQSGLMAPIGKWVLNEACTAAAGWPGGHFVAVNLSPAQFRNARLVSTVTDVLSKSGLPACRLEVEVTEGVLLQQTTSILATLHELRNLGVRIAMDDFGTGYSSLSYLRAFPFDRVKIDRSFVEDIERNPDSAAIVRAIITLGRNLGISTTAEGIETEPQRDRIVAEGCDNLQGYLLGRPMRPDQVAELIAASAERVA